MPPHELTRAGAPSPSSSICIAADDVGAAITRTSLPCVAATHLDAFRSPSASTCASGSTTTSATPPATSAAACDSLHSCLYLPPGPYGVMPPCGLTSQTSRLRRLGRRRAFTLPSKGPIRLSTSAASTVCPHPSDASPACPAHGAILMRPLPSRMSASVPSASPSRPVPSIPFPRSARCKRFHRRRRRRAAAPSRQGSVRSRPLPYPQACASMYIACAIVPL